MLLHGFHGMDVASIWSTCSPKNLNELLQVSIWVDLTSSTFWLMFGYVKRGDRKGVVDMSWIIKSEVICSHSDQHPDSSLLPSRAREAAKFHLSTHHDPVWSLQQLYSVKPTGGMRWEFMQRSRTAVTYVSSHAQLEEKLWPRLLTALFWDGGNLIYSGAPEFLSCSVLKLLWFALPHPAAPSWGGSIAPPHKQFLKFLARTLH